MEPLQSRLLEAVLDISHDNIVIADAAGRVLLASPSCLRIYGVAAEELVASTVFELEARKVFLPSVTAVALRTGERSTALQTTLTGRHVIATAVPVSAAGGRVSHVVSSSYDLSDIEVLRAEYAALSEQMQHRLAAVEDDPAGPGEVVEGVVFASRIMRDLCALVRRIAATDVTVLLLGPSGAGKTTLARLLHRLGKGGARPFVELNCGAIPEALFESELFGYEAGAFTGARGEGKPGLIERADGGTLLLDEVGDLSEANQRKLLKVLEDRRVTRLGGTRERPVGFRLVASTNRDLPAMVAEGGFRLDLYYRLNLFPIRVPPLSQRPADVAALLRLQLDGLAAKYGQRKPLSLGAEQALMRHAWPGNARELENVLERLYLSAEGAIIDDAAAALGEAEDSTRTGAVDPVRVTGLRATVEEFERGLIERARGECASTYEMARFLGISQSGVVRRMRKFGLPPPG